MLRISNIKIPYEFIPDDIISAASDRLRVEKSRIVSFKIVKKSLDITNDEGPIYNICVVVLLSGDEREVLYNRIDKSITEEISLDYIIKKRKLNYRPLIIGFGPAGLFAGLVLAKSGAKPIIIEQGKPIDERLEDIKNLKYNGILNAQSNVQFGEGGAGAYSDGKLKIGKKDPIKMFVLNEMVKNGAPDEILYLDKPHIGTDNLSMMVKNIRNEIISFGGDVLYNRKMTGVILKSGKICGVEYLQDNKVNELYSESIVMAIGNSADDTFRNLYSRGVEMQARPVSIGVRIEHPREYINKIVYSKHYGSIKETADYRMVVHLQNERGVYTFCMCPGGEVISATSNENAVVTNGMSFYKRNALNSNSALLVTMGKDECNFDYPLSVLDFQRNLERKTFEFGGGGYKAPVQKLEDFLKKTKTGNLGEVFPSYLPGIEFAKFDDFIPDYITDSLRKAIFEMDEWMPGFIYPDAILTGTETRSSSPVRILRNQRLQCVNTSGLYPCGEGGGYSGGIVSAAADGVRCAENIINNA